MTNKIIYYSLVIISVILIISLIYIMHKNKIIQHFTNDLVGYNSSYIPVKKIDTDFDIKSDGLENILNKTNLEKDYDEDLSEYNLFNENLEFPYTGIFKDVILNYLNNVITIYKDDNCYISDIFKIYFKDIVTKPVFNKPEKLSRIYIFYINLVNPVKLFTKSLKIKLSIDDHVVIDKNKIIENIKILYINYDSNKTMNISGIDAYSGNFYIIKNKLHLMDPFLTTGKEMIVSKNMIDKFKTTLEMKKQSQKILEEKLKTA